MRCNNCHAVFDEHDMVRVREDYGETYYACPICGDSDVSETEECELCGVTFDPDDLTHGFCLDCLWNAIDYDVALKYMIQKDNGLGLVNFFLEEWFNSDSIKHTSTDLVTFFVALFGKLANQERDNIQYFNLNSKVKIEPSFLNACRTHILPSWPKLIDENADEFAEWYEEYRKESK